MSMILDAIKRARDEQRDKSTTPSLDSDHFVAPMTSRRPLWLIAGISTVIAGLLVIIVLLVNDGAAPDGQSVVSPKAPVIINRSNSGTVANDSNGADVQREVALQQRNRSTMSGWGVSKTRPAEPARIPQSVDSSVVALYASAENSPQSGALKTDSATDETASLDTSRLDTLAQRPTSNDQTTTTIAQSPAELPLPASDARLVEEVIDIESVLKRAQRAIGEPQLQPHGTPLLENLSQQTKDKIPSVFYTVHQYDNYGSDSIVINGQRAQVDGRVQGFTVKEILSDSAILSWNGIDFRLRALNSWVNL